MKTAVVVSASSDIGEALCRRWSARGTRVFGTYRTPSEAVARLVDEGVRLTPCDLTRKPSITQACARLRRLCPQWDVLALCPGWLDPIGAFADCDFDAWESSISVNFIQQLRIVRELLPARRRGKHPTPTVLFFAGGGTNGAPVNYSAYTVSKIALIKMCELLDAEVPDTRFAILGPGWVKTKIHDSTLKAGRKAGESYARTAARLRSGDFTPLERVLDCCDWLIGSPRSLVGGRNFSVAFDAWGTEMLRQKLARDRDLYKLRRSGNQAPAQTR